MVFISVFFLFPLKVSAAKEPVIRVLVGNENTVKFRGDGFNSIFVKGILINHRTIDSIRLTYNNGDIKYSINNLNNEWYELPSDFSLTIKNNDKRGIWFKNRRYPGELRVLLKNEKIQIINYVKLEKYLKSVVGSEMPKEFPLAALQAQAIAARTYALKLLGKNKTFDIRSNQNSQVYLGLEAETLKTSRAVKSTSDLVLFYNNKLIDAVFHSSSGGRTEDSGEVWKYQLPYLRSVIDYDQNSTKFKWSAKFSSRELVDTFPGLGGVNGIKIIKKSNSNRALKVLVYGPYGKEIFSGKDLRKRFKLLSTKFEVDLRFNELNKTNYAYHNSGMNYRFKNNEDFLLQPLPSIPKDYFLFIKGFGAGHGVGMSQWGAKAMAEKGASFQEILKHYYTGVKIRSY